MNKLLPDITPLLITYNEEPNIARVLEKLSWAHQIVVIDSGSTDATLDILANTANVRVITRKFDTFAGQCNFGLEQIETSWALSMDADYVLSDELIDKIKILNTDTDFKGYRTPFIYRIHGHDVRGSLYPPRTVLYQISNARYEDEGHGHRVRISGNVQDLRAPIYHDDRKSLSRWLGSQRSYAVREADHLLATDKSNLSRVDHIRAKTWILPPLMLFYVLFAKGAIFSGLPGWYYALQRSLAEVMIALELLDRRLENTADKLDNPTSKS